MKKIFHIAGWSTFIWYSIDIVCSSHSEGSATLAIASYTM